MSSLICLFDIPLVGPRSTTSVQSTRGQSNGESSVDWQCFVLLFGLLAWLLLPPTLYPLPSTASVIRYLWLGSRVSYRFASHANCCSINTHLVLGAAHLPRGNAVSFVDSFCLACDGLASFERIDGYRDAGTHTAHAFTVGHCALLVVISTRTGLAPKVFNRRYS